MSQPMHWSRWGNPDHASTLPEHAATLIDAVFGTDPRPAVEIGDVRLPAPGLTAGHLAELRRLVGSDHVHTDHETRVRHTRGKSTPDLLRIRAGDGSDAPDVVVRPADADEVLGVVEWCSDVGVALVPFGGGTSVVGGLTARRDGFAGVVALDLARLDRLVSIDLESRTAELGAGLLGPAAEALLAEHGMTLGHFPQSFEYASIGGFAATRSSGQASSGFGRFDALVVGLKVATPIGTLDLGTAPANAAGPDLRQLVLGSEGAFGVITSVTVRVRPVAETRVYETWRFDTFLEGAAALRALKQDGIAPTVLRLSDEAETSINLARPQELAAGAGDAADDMAGDTAGDMAGDENAGGSLMVTGFEGTVGYVDRARALVTERVTALGGACLGTQGGEAWEQGRFSGPYLRDSLLDVGVLVETLETATFWSSLPRLYRDVRTALETSLAGQGTDPIVLCHISHVYETGASLYFTVAAKQTADPVAQWAVAKAAASDAMIAAGATITHHHAVGRDHLPWFAQEVGPVGVEMLRAVKSRLDPAGVLNPGVLVP